jgi:CRP-like cAMP-binding protein
MNTTGGVPVGRWSNRLLRTLPREPSALLEQDLRQVSLTQGRVCFEAGKAIDQVYFPLTGMISLLVATGDGEMVETGTIGCEGAAGLQCGLGESYSYGLATVQIPGNFATITAKRFREVAFTNQGSDLPLHRDLVVRGAAECCLQCRSRRFSSSMPVAVANGRLHRQQCHTADARVSG